MKNLISKAITNVATFVKSFHLRQTLTVACAIFLLFTSTACGSKSFAATPGTYNDASQPKNSASKYGQDAGKVNRELYKPTQQRTGGMNNYNDDPRYDKGASQGKVERLMNRAERNLEKRADNPRELRENIRQEPVGEKVRGFTNQVGTSAERLKDNVSQHTQSTIQDIKEGADSIRRDAPHIGNEARQNADNATRGVREGAKDLTEAATPRG